MSVVFMDGFDHLSAADLVLKWASTSSTVGASKTTGIYGFGSAQRILGANRTIQTPPLTAAATYIVALHVRFESLPASDVILLNWRESTTSHCDLRLTAAGALRATRNGTSLGISSTGIIATGTWYWLAVQVTVHDTTGVVTVYLNNTSVLALTSQDTRNGGTGVVDNVQVNTPSSGNNDLDNFVLLDTSGSTLNAIPTEEWRIDTQTATGAGNSTQFTPSTGSNWQNVDDATQDGDSTYNSSSTSGHTDLFAIADFSGGTPRAVQTCITARRDDAGPREIREKCRSGSTNYNGTTQAITASYAVYRQIREVDPNTSAAWTGSNLNSAEFGYELVT